MEEKERYELNDNDCIIDNEKDVAICDVCDVSESPKTLVDLLNQQSMRIKELEEELDDAKRDYIPKLEFGLQRANKMGRDAEKEIQQLKQQLHDLPKKIVEEIRDVAGDYWDFNMCEECGNVPDLNTLTMEDFDEILDAILEKYGEEDE